MLKSEIFNFLVIIFYKNNYRQKNFLFLSKRRETKKKAFNKTGLLTKVNKPVS